MDSKNLQTMEDALVNVPEKLKYWFSVMWDAIVKRKVKNLKYIKDLGDVSQKTKEAIEKFYGKTVSKQVITPYDLKHIYNRHGKDIEKELADGQIPITAEIIALIPDVLANPDNAIESNPTGKSGYETIALSKEYADGMIHVVEAILKNNVLEVYTVYIWNKEKTEKKRLASKNDIVP